MKRKKVDLDELAKNFDYVYLKEIFKLSCIENINNLRKEINEIELNGNNANNKDLSLKKENLFTCTLMLADERVLNKAFQIDLCRQIKEVLYDHANFKWGEVTKKLKKDIDVFGLTLSLDGIYSEEELRRNLVNAVGFEFIPREEFMNYIISYNKIRDDWCRTFPGTDQYFTLERKLKDAGRRVDRIACKSFLSYAIDEDSKYVDVGICGNGYEYDYLKDLNKSNSNFPQFVKPISKKLTR